MKTPNPGYLSLAPVIRRRGYTLTQVKRTKRAAVYRVEGAGLEVIKIRLAKECVLGGKIIEAREVGPSDEQFGSQGWYYMRGQEEEAEKKWEEIK